MAAANARGTSLWLVGLADLWTRQWIEQTVAKVPEGQPLIALTHNPDIFPRLHACRCCWLVTLTAVKSGFH